MRPTDSPWLTDENIHPEVVAHLRSLGLDVFDFGTLPLLRGRPVVGIVRLRPGHFRAQITINTLDRLFALELDPSPPFLIVVQGGQARLHTWGS